MKITQLFGQHHQLITNIEQQRDRLYRVAFAWCHDAMLADDLVQDTLARGIQNIKQLKDPEALPNWLFSILNNQWREYLRRNRPSLDIDELVFEADTTPEKVHRQQQTADQVRTAIAELPLSQRQTITMVDLEDMSYQEVSHALDIPIGTVMSRLNRARKALVQKLHYQETNRSISYLRRVK